MGVAITMTNVQDIKSLDEIPDDDDSSEVVIIKGAIGYRLHVRRLTNGEWMKIEYDEPPPVIDPNYDATGHPIYDYDTPFAREKIGRRNENIRMKRIVASILEDVPGGNKTKLATDEQVEFLNNKFGDQGIIKLERIIMGMRGQEASSIMLADTFHASADYGLLGDGEVEQDAE